MRSLLCLLAAGAFAAPHVARADCPANPKLVTYHKPATLPSPPTTRCEIDHGKCKSVELRGYLYVPAASVKGPYPLLINNHGSEPLPGEKCEDGTYFSGLGYVVFVPHRRGQGKSTGVDFTTYTSQFCSTPGNGGKCKMEYLHKQVDDVADAIEYAKSLPAASGGGKLVDPKRIAIIGHSFGGITTVFANAKDLGQRAVIDVAGGSQSWEGNPDAQAEMEEAVKNAVAPIYFLEPMNDHSIDPTIDLARVAGNHCKQYQSALFPALDVTGDGKITAADYATTDIRDKAHGTFMNHTEVWAASAHEFMTRYFTAPAAPFDKHCSGTSHATN